MLVMFCGILFSACQNGVFAKTVYLIDYPTSSSVIEIETSQKITATVAMTPSNVTDREFEASILDEDKQDMLSFEYDYKEMKLSIIATSDLGDAKTVNLSIKIKAKKSDASSTVKVKIVAPESPEIKSLASPEVSIDASANLSWTKVDGASSYYIEICEGETVLKTQTIKNAFNLQLNANDYIGKSIVAKIKAKAKTPDLDSEFSILYFDVLNSPANLRFDAETQKVVWDEVQNSNGYNLKFGSKVLHTNQNYFDANGYFDVANMVDVSVMSVGSVDNRYLQSNYSNQIKVAKLQAVSGWQLVGDVLNWDLVDGATKYSVKISNGQSDIITETQNTYIDLSQQNIDAGNHSILVCAVGQNSGSVYSINGDARQFNFQKNQKVSGLKLEDGKIKWASTASAYKIFIDGEFYRETRVASFDYSQIASQMITDFDVVALGDNATKISSDKMFEDGLKIYKLSAPELTFDGNEFVSWNMLANASGYQIILDNNINISKNKEQTSVSIFNEAVDYSSPTNFSFVAKGDVDGEITSSKIYLDSDAVYRTISKLGAVNLQFAKNSVENCIMWSGTNAGGYKIFATDGETDFESEIIYQSYFAVSNFVTEQNISTNKQYRVWAKTISIPSTEQNWYLSSDNSQSITITKLANVELAIQDGVVIWDYTDTDNILGYQVALKSGEQSIDVQNINASQNSYDFKTDASGVYTFEIVAVGDTNKNFISSTKSSITISKLNQIQNVKIEKTTTSDFYNPLDKYTISFEDKNDGNAKYICTVDEAVVGLTKNQNTYSLDIYGSQIGQTMKIKIAVGGDSEQFINCDAFEISLSKLDEPIVSSNSSGTAIETNANKYFGLIKVDGQDLAQTFEGTKANEILLSTGKQFKIKSVAFADEQTLQNGGALVVDSLFSEVYKVSKLPTPKLYVQNGTLKVESTGSDDASSYYFNFEVNGTKVSTEYKNFANLNTNIEESFGTCVVSGYFTDKNSGSMNDGTIYLKSDVCDGLSIKKLPKPTSVYIRDGVVYVTFEEGKTLFGGKLAIYVNGRDVTENDNTQTSYEFAKNHDQAGKYSVSARAISQMSGFETSITYSLHGDESEKINITKLAKVEDISVTAFVPEENGTIANLVASISAANNQLPKSMPYQTGFIRFKAVTDAVRYCIQKSTNENVKFYVDKTANSDGYVYVNMQGTDFGSGSNSIKVTAIGNQKEIIDGETSDSFDFAKLIAPQNVRVENGKVVWTDSNNPNNSSLSNDSMWVVVDTVTYPKWLLEASKNAIVYYALINGRYYCTLDLSSMSSLDLDELCKLTNNLKDLSYDPNLETTVANVYTIQICASPLNSYVNSSLIGFATSDDVMSISAKRTNKIYVNSDLSNSILVSPITAPYGLTIENKILKWLTPYSNSSSAESLALQNNGFEVYGYQLRVYKNGEVQYFGEGDDAKDYTLISGASNTSWNFENYLSGFSTKEGNYSFEVKTLVRQTGTSPSIYYINSAYSLSFSATALETPTLGILNGQIAWELVNGSTGYEIEIDGTTKYTTYDDIDKFELKDEIYIFVGDLSEGEHNVKISAKGGDEKNLISSPASTAVKYTKLKKSTLYVDDNSGLIKFDEFAGGQLLTDNENWSYFVMVDGFEDVDWDHKTTFDMSEKDNKYSGGKVYTISVVAKNTTDGLVVNSEDSSKMILNSDVSEELLAYKLSAPSKFEVVDNYQSVSWTNKDGYVKNLNYVISIANNAISTNYQTKYDFDGSGEVNATVSVSAIYNGTVTIDDIQYSCLKSDANEYVAVHKLSAPTNIQIKDGVMSWTKSLDAETHLIIKDANEIIDKESYDFAEEAPGAYRVYLYNLVAERLRERTDTDIYLSSKSTSEYKITKLDTPTKFNIVQTYDIADNLKSKYLFDFENIIDAVSYKIAIKNGVEEIYSFDLEKQIGVDSIQLALDEQYLSKEIIEKLNSGEFEIYVKAIGNTVTAENLNSFDTNFACSNVNYLSIKRIASTDKIDVQKDDILSGSGTLQKTFTGRLDWQTVDDAKTYLIEIEYLSDVDASSYVFANNFGEPLYSFGNKKIYEFNETYCQFAHSGDYAVKVIAVPEIAVANKLDDNSYQNIIQSCDVVLDETISYSLFADGEGIKSNPYIVSSFEQFSCIKYNIYAYYRLAENIDYTNASFYGREFNTINKFYGEIDGNDNALILSNAQNFAGIVEDLQAGAKICNLTLNGTITSLKENENEIVVGGFASYNYGTIEKCLNKLNQISPTTSAFATIGGIVAVNYGTIKQSGNLSNITGNIVGGIVAKMFGETVSECYNGTDGSLTIKSKVAQLPYDFGDMAKSTYCGFAGGIVGYQNGGEISSCYDYASVLVDNLTTGTAYVGGIVSYATNGATIKNCYAVDNYIKNVGRLIKASVSDRSKTGILIGFMADNIQILNCAAVYQNSSGTITTAQIVYDAVGSDYSGDQITGIIKNGSTEYQYIYNVVSENNSGIFVNNTNKYCTLANAKYN